MDNNYNNFLYPSEGNSEVPSKRQKMNMNNSSIVDPPNVHPLAEKQWNDRTRVLAALRQRVLQAGAIAVQFYKMKVQIEEIISEEERNLEMNMKMNREIMKQIEIALDPSMRRPQEQYEAQASAEAEMCDIRTRIGVKMTNLLTKTSRTDHLSHHDTPTFSKAQKNKTRNQKELRIAEKEVGSSQVLKEEWVSQIINRNELEEAKTTIPKLNSEKVAHANELGLELQSSEVIISTHHGTGSGMGDLVLADQMFSIREGLKNVESFEQLMMFLPEKSDELSSSLHCCGSIISKQEDGTAGAVKPDSQWIQPGPSQHPTNYENSSEVLDLSLPSFNKVDGDCKAELSGQGLKLMSGKHYVLVSHPQFFTVNWKAHYTRWSRYKYTCNECSSVRSSMIRMQDHIWSKHYGGRFNCPFCPNTRSLRSRQGVKDHRKRFHPNSFLQEK